MVGVADDPHLRSLFRLDPSYRRPRRGSVVVGGSPLRLFRLSPAGVVVAEALERGDPLPAGHDRLTSRLVDAGAVHPVAVACAVGPGDGPTGPVTDHVTAVVPAYRQSASNDAVWPGAVPDVACTVVVDDASPQPLQVHGVRVGVIRLEHNRGPGGARNAGLATVTTPFVAFVDTDVTTSSGWLQPLLAHFADPRVALVAPRVCTASGGSALVDGYERRRGSLDLGTQEGRVAPGSRIGFVPGAALVCRTGAVRAIGGFDESLRFGEDVDLVWRLHEAGWRCRYEPAVEVEHAPRRTFCGWLTQRYRYGSSAAPLARRHPGAVAPLRISAWSAAVWALAVARRPVSSVAVAAATTVALQHRLAGLPPGESARLAVSGHLRAGEQIASAVRRVWWPVAVVGAAVVPRARPWLVAATLAPSLAQWWRLPRRPVGARAVAFLAMNVADDVAYGAGVWAGALRTHSFGALLPDLSNWPPRRRSGGAAGRPDGTSTVDRR